MEKSDEKETVSGENHLQTSDFYDPAEDMSELFYRDSRRYDRLLEVES